MRTVVILAALSLAAFGQPAQPTGNQKVGFADWDYIFSQMPEYKQIESAVKAHGEQLQTQMKAKAQEYESKVDYYQMGASKWVKSDTFPVKGTKYLDFYLTSAGHANTLYGDGALGVQRPKQSATDSFIYDPLRPVQTLGGGACCMGSVKATGAFDQSTLEMRSDILVYSTPPLDEDLTVAGFVEAVWPSQTGS